MIIRKRMLPKTPESLANKYRPSTWDEVVGQDAIIDSVRALLDGGGRRSFLFSGPSGTGKTTIARLIARHIGCRDNYRESDSATYTGIDRTRELIEWMRYWPFRTGAKKVACVDEAHSLSHQALESLLKSVESPPTFGYWVLCTTELDNIPETLRSRCACCVLRPIPTELIIPRLALINKAERLGMSWGTLCFIAGRADGNLRRAVALLEQCRYTHTPEDIARLLSR